MYDGVMVIFSGLILASFLFQDEFSTAMDAIMYEVGVGGIFPRFLDTNVKFGAKNHSAQIDVKVAARNPSAEIDVEVGVNDPSAQGDTKASAIDSSTHVDGNFIVHCGRLNEWNWRCVGKGS